MPVSAPLFRIDTIAMMSRTRRGARSDAEHAEPPSLRALQLFRDRLLLREEVEVLAASGLRVRAGHVEAAERVHADERARALAVQVEVADVELALSRARAARGRASRASRSGRTRVSLATRDALLEAPDLQDREHGAEDLLAREAARAA